MGRLGGAPQGLERGILASSRTFCVDFHRWVFQIINMRPASVEPPIHVNFVRVTTVVIAAVVMTALNCGGEVRNPTSEGSAGYSGSGANSGTSGTGQGSGASGTGGVAGDGGNGAGGSSEMACDPLLPDGTCHSNEDCSDSQECNFVVDESPPCIASHCTCDSEGTVLGCTSDCQQLGFCTAPSKPQCPDSTPTPNTPCDESQLGLGCSYTPNTYCSCSESFSGPSWQCFL